MKKPKADKGKEKRRKSSNKRKNLLQKTVKIIETTKSMTVNFLDVRCQELPISASQFGICDDQNGLIAYTDTTDSSKWIATVNNPQATPVTFTAVDNCVEILRGDGDADRKCDGMMTYSENLVFVELKEVKSSWISDAVEQLEITIQHFIANHDIGIFRHKRAFACNKKHPNFHVIDNETKRRFFDTYRIRLNVQATIQI